MLQELASLNPDQLLLVWVNHHLGSMRIHGHSVKRRVGNFSSDWADGKVLALLVHQLLPELCTEEVVYEIDPQRRVQLALRALSFMQPPCSNFITVGQVLEMDEVRIAALVARLFTTCPGLAQPWFLGQERDMFARCVFLFQRMRSAARLLAGGTSTVGCCLGMVPWCAPRSCSHFPHLATIATSSECKLHDRQAGDAGHQGH